LLANYVVITQGFIGGSEEGFTTTLGREGSDFTASILANCLQADSVTIWKDVPGVLNADPKLFDDTVLFQALNYYDAAEMTYYGASVIHPKTIKPLADKHIPLHVRSFLQPDAPGTVIRNDEPPPAFPTLIVKKNQTLISFGVKDLSFIDEVHISTVLKAFYQCNFKINIMQNSAVTFSVCVDTKEHLIQEVEALLKEQFNIHYNQNLTLLTVKNYALPIIEKAIGDGKVMLEQRTRHTYQVIFQ
jgi:aspartate kinase